MANPADFNTASVNSSASDSVMRIEDGNKIWRNANGERHRTDGPAIEWESGSKWWCLNDQLHRTDGPAVEGADGSKEWYLNDKRLTEQAFNKHPLVLEAQRQKEATSQAEDAAARSRRLHVLLKLAR